MGRIRKRRRSPHGSAWHWSQTDCWYNTLPGTKKADADENGERIWYRTPRGTKHREPRVDDLGNRIRGRENVSVRWDPLEFGRALGADGLVGSVGGGRLVGEQGPQGLARGAG